MSSDRERVFGLNTLIYGVVILCVITFLPEGIWPRIVRYRAVKGALMMLQVRDLTKAFRGLVAVKDVNFDVPKGRSSP